MKLLGALAVVAAGVLFGIIRSELLFKRERCLSAVIDSLRYMGSELKLQSQPLPELIREMSENAAAPVREYYVNLYMAIDLLGEQSFESLWSELVMTDKSLEISDRQREILCKAGSFMGKFSVEDQALALEGCVARLEPEYNRAHEKAIEGRRLYPGLGLTAGLMLAALFI